MARYNCVISATPEHSSIATWGWDGFSSSANNSLNFQPRELILVLEDRGQLSYL